MMYVADLHVHTRISDCSESIQHILQQAKERGITHIAFTDHDTTKFANEHVLAAGAYGIRAIPAVEMSAFGSAEQKKAHILGYGYRSVQHIEAIGQRTLQKRDANGVRQIEILRGLGYRIWPEHVRRISGDCIYKQHILDYLVSTKQAMSIYGDVYTRIFKNGGPCDFDIDYPEAADVIRAIKEDGGYAVLAHPGQQDNFEMLPKLIEAGLDGIEYAHPSHTEEDRIKVAELGKYYGVFMTGGSDYHGRYERSITKLGAYPAHESSGKIYGL